MPSYNGGIFNLPPYQGPYRQQPIRTVPNDPSYGHVYGPNGPNVIRNYNNVIQVPVQ